MNSVFLSFKLFKAVLFSNILVHLKVLSAVVFLNILFNQVISIEYNFLEFFYWILFLSLQIYIGKEILASDDIEQFEQRFAQVNLQNYLFNNIIAVLIISVFFLLLYSIVAISFMLFYQFIVFYFILGLLASYLFPIVCGRIFLAKSYTEISRELITIFKGENIAIAFSKQYFFMIFFLFFPLFIFEIFNVKFLMTNQGNILYEASSLIGDYFIGILIVSILGSISMFLAKENENINNNLKT